MNPWFSVKIYSWPPICLASGGLYDVPPPNPVTKEKLWVWLLMPNKIKKGPLQSLKRALWIGVPLSLSFFERVRGYGGKGKLSFFLSTPLHTTILPHFLVRLVSIFWTIFLSLGLKSYTFPKKHFLCTLMVNSCAIKCIFLIFCNW